jgi:hypothetical protein
MAQVLTITRGSRPAKLQIAERQRLSTRTPLHQFANTPDVRRSIVHCFREREESLDAIARKVANPGRPGPVRAEVVRSVATVLRDEWEDQEASYRMTIESQREAIAALMAILRDRGVEPDGPLPTHPMCHRRAA